MSKGGRPVAPLHLSAAERRALEALVGGDGGTVLAVRGQIILRCAEGQANKDVAQALGLTPATVGKWRRRFTRLGMAGLDDGPRTGRPRLVDRAHLEDLYAGGGTRGLAQALGVSQSTAARSLREGIPHRRVASLPPSPPGQAGTPGTPGTPGARPRPAPELLSDRVYEVVRGWIVGGELTPGTRIVESEVARILGTSQTPAREAVRRLALEGLVTHRPRLGSFVTQISQVEAREAREVRVLIETAAARRATGHLTPEELTGLRSQVERMRDAAERADIASFREADLHFHRQVCALSGNSMLLRVWATLEPALWNLQVVSSAMFSGDWALMAQRHDDLVSALLGHDPSEAARLFAAHARGESSAIRPSRRRAEDTRVVCR